MKNQLLSFLALAIVLLGASACKKDRWLDEETAADIMVKSLEQNSGGLAREAELQTTYLALNLALIPCGDTANVTRNFAYNSGGNTANADYQWEIVKHCPNPEVYLTWQANFTGDYDFPRIKGSFQGQRNWIATQIAPEFNAWLLNGTCNRSGSHESKVRRRQTFDATTETSFTNILVDKNTRRLIGGTASSVINVVTQSGNNYEYNAETTISSDGVATIVINGNTTFTFNLY
jgi:hypothetical protein